MGKRETITLENRCCMDCGKKFNAQIDKKTKKILSEDWYYGTIREGVGDWASDRLETNPDGSIKCVRINSRRKEFWYRLKDFKRTIFHQYEDIEMWVCKDCVLAQYGNKVQVRSENPSERYTEKICVPHYSKKDD